MNKYIFETDAEAEAYCDKIATAMEALFAVPAAEAVARINQQWVGLVLTGNTFLLYQETPEYWANQIYWEYDSFWWIQGQDRERLGLPPPAAKPAPKDGVV